MQKFRKGTRVTWAWGAHTATGKIAESFTRDVKRTIKGTEVVRKASAGNVPDSSGSNDYFYQASNFPLILQAQLELVAQARERMAYGGLRHAQPVTGPREVLLLHDRVEDDRDRALPGDAGSEQGEPGRVRGEHVVGDRADDDDQQEDRVEPLGQQGLQRGLRV